MLGLEAGIVDDDREVVNAGFDPADRREVAAVEKLMTEAITNGAVAETIREIILMAPKSPLAKLKVSPLMLWR